VYTKLSIGDVVTTTQDFNNPDVELFSLHLGKLHLSSNKKTDLKIDVVFNSNKFEGVFGSTLNIPPKYYSFIQAQIPQTNQSLSRSPLRFTGFNGCVNMTPDGRKDIEFTFEKADIIVFSFLIRFIVELLSLDDVKEHHGFEETNVGVTAFLLRINDAELCLVSNEESCLVVKSSFL
jgi:hypothetical protein